MTEEVKLKVKFFRTSSGTEPVREWLTDPRKMLPEDRKTIGEDIKTVQFGWPMGMPMVRKLEIDLWEVRSNISVGIARVLFTILENEMILLHSFIKKDVKTPMDDLNLARNRKTLLLRGIK